MKGPVGPGETLHWVGLAVRRLTGYVRSFGKRRKDGRYVGGSKEAIDQYWNEMCLFAGLPSWHFYPPLTGEQQIQFEKTGFIGRRLPIGRGGVPHEVHEACQEITFKLADPADRVAVPGEALDRLNELAEYVSKVADRYGPTQMPDLLAELGNLAVAFEEEQFDHAGLRVLLSVRPLGSPEEDPSHHGFLQVHDKKFEYGTFPEPFVLKTWIAGDPNDPQRKPIADGIVRHASGWRRSPAAGVQVRLSVFGERQHTEAFLKLATRAGSLLSFLPDGCARGVAVQGVDPFELSTRPEERWMLALFPLTWRRGAASGLRAWRGVVDNGGPVTLPLEPAALKATIGVQSNNSRSLGEVFKRMPVPPDDYVAVLSPDLFAASALACRLLAAVLNPSDFGATRASPPDKARTRTSPEEASTRDSKPEHCFQLHGERWLIQFGAEAGSFSTIDGFDYLHQLIRAANKPLPASQLVQSRRRNEGDARTARSVARPTDEVEAGEGPAGAAKPDPALGPEGMAELPRAIAEVKENVEGIRAQIDNAQAEGREPEVERLTRDELHPEIKKLNALLEHQRALIGRGGISRPVRESDTSRARQRVRKAVDSAIERIRDGEMVACADHFKAAIPDAIEGSFVYRPESLPSWNT